MTVYSKVVLIRDFLYIIYLWPERDVFSKQIIHEDLSIEHLKLVVMIMKVDYVVSLLSFQIDSMKKALVWGVVIDKKEAWNDILNLILTVGIISKVWQAKVGRTN